MDNLPRDLASESTPVHARAEDVLAVLGQIRA